MNNKITFPELVDMVAKKAGTSKRVAELFLKELFATVTQALAAGESVKVKGIGSFKVIQVNARRSVNVNTGEEIEIPGHRKLTFVADKAMAKAVNQPFAQFDTVVLNDDVTDEQLAAVDQEPIASSNTNDEDEAPLEQAPEAGSEKQAEADVEEAMAAVVKSSAVPADEVTEDEPADEQLETPPAFVPTSSTVWLSAQESAASSEPQPTISQSVQQDDQDDQSECEEPMAGEDEHTVQHLETDGDGPAVDGEHSQEDDHAVETADDDTCDEQLDGDNDGRIEAEKQKRRIMHRSLLEGFVVGVVTTIIVLLVSYRVYLMKCPKGERAAVGVTAVDAVKPAQPSARKIASSRVPQGRTERAATPVAKIEAAPARAQVQQTVYDTIKPSTTLNRMSSKHYGKGVFWVYIYEENKAVIDDPNMIPMGTRLVIPPASKYGIDKNNPASVEAAKKKQSQIYNRMLKKGSAAGKRTVKAAVGSGSKNRHVAGKRHAKH